MNILLNILDELIILFFVFSILGWITEVTLKYIQFHRFINRGFLIGPYCPIYGAGVVTVTVIVGGLVGRHGTIFETFFAGMVICGALEYFTSWYMEKFFHARWWDYSQKPMNLHGRIWMGNLILFGLASVIIVWWFDPAFFKVIEGIKSEYIKYMAVIIVIIVISDNVVSHFMMNIVKKEIDNRKGDSTEEITKEIRVLLKDKQMLIRRINDAYPNLQARPKRLKDEIKNIKKEYKKEIDELKRIKAEYEKEIDELKKQFK
ncbi:hypothetical protein EXD82_03100 [Peptacetobacter hominis]|uniref:ABC transporter permease n=1 Tax=Peptacetobacter hominis TaxID=2743610 RepID=A0A544QWN0_9FIRM|nr:hypothetical protein [Peptacetobacter hominis]TQQ85097.1 hypothetical protein EXD82_03100 [Peptacetobacter hominis]